VILITPKDGDPFDPPAHYRKRLEGTLVQRGITPDRGRGEMQVETAKRGPAAPGRLERKNSKSSLSPFS